MKLFALVAAAIVFTAPAFATAYVDATIVSVDKKQQRIVLSDKSIMMLDSSIGTDSVHVGKKVRIFAEMDEDGFSPITKIDVIQ